jgi:hypothetical protein
VNKVGAKAFDEVIDGWRHFDDIMLLDELEQIDLRIAVNDKRIHSFLTNGKAPCRVIRLNAKTVRAAG